MTTTTPDQGDERRAFEANFPMPGMVSWNGAGYTIREGSENSYTADRFIGRWDAWQAARALSAAQPVAQEAIPLGFVSTVDVEKLLCAKAT